jgi:hypothetical protein
MTQKSILYLVFRHRRGRQPILKLIMENAESLLDPPVSEALRLNQRSLCKPWRLGAIYLNVS